jgi:hypothetical protein
MVCVTATLISLHQGVQGTASLKESPTVATTRDKLLSFCQHRRACLAAILLLLLLAIILVTLTVYLTYDIGSNVTEHTFYPPPKGKSGTPVSVPRSRFLFINPLTPNDI